MVNLDGISTQSVSNFIEKNNMKVFDDKLIFKKLFWKYEKVTWRILFPFCITYNVSFKVYLFQ